MKQRKDGRWQDQIPIGNGKYKYFYGKTKAELRSKMVNYHQNEEVKTNFEVIAEQWYDTNESQVAYTTHKGYSGAYTRAVSEFRGRGIVSITPQEIAAHINRMRLAYAQKTLANQLLVYRLIFQYAIDHGHLFSKPRCAPHNSTGL